MNRRKAILGILALGGTAAIGISGIKWWSLQKPADLGYLENKRDLIADLAEVIIPRTDTPGAKDAKVEDFILKALKEFVDPKEQNNFVNGIKGLEDMCKEKFLKPFSQCTKLQQQEILAILEDEEGYETEILQKVRDKVLGKPFFALLKELTVKGYCRSEIGATKGLAYVAIPGEYRSCILLHPEQKSWATN